MQILDCALLLSFAGTIAFNGWCSWDMRRREKRIDAKLAALHESIILWNYGAREEAVEILERIGLER